MNGETRGPFPIVANTRVSDPNDEITEPLRSYDCKNYEICLAVAAALNWHSFTCNQCAGQYDESLFWRAHQARKRDQLVSKLCSLPNIPAVETPPAEAALLKANEK